MSSSPGPEIDMETEDWIGIEFPGGEEEGGLELCMVGNGCLALMMLTGDEGLGCETPLALLSLRFLYSATLFWKVVLMGENFAGETFPKSSADLDHALREMVRRSPRPLELDTEGVEGDPGALCEISRDPGGRIDKSRTDLSCQEKVNFIVPRELT